MKNAALGSPDRCTKEAGPSPWGVWGCATPPHRLLRVLWGNYIALVGKISVPCCWEDGFGLEDAGNGPSDVPVAGQVKNAITSKANTFNAGKSTCLYEHQ